MENKLRSYSGRQGKSWSRSSISWKPKSAQRSATVSALLANSATFPRTLEYDDAKNEQAAIEVRIAEITRILGEATIVRGSHRIWSR